MNLMFFFDLLKEKQMIIKPTLGSEGSGVEIVKIAKEDDLFEWFTSLQTKLQKTKERWVGEELLVQSDEMRSFYPHAINTPSYEDYGCSSTLGEQWFTYG